MLTTLREVEALAADWRALESGVNLPMLTAAWVRACASTMPERLRIATVRNNDKLVAAAPLAIVGSGLSKRLEFVGSASLFEPMDVCAVDEESRAALIAQVRRAGLPLRLERVPADSPTIDAVQAQYRGGVVIVRPDVPGPFVTLGPAWAEPESQLSSKRRYDLRRAGRRAAQAGPIAVDVIAPAPGDVDPLFDRVIAVEARSWKGASGSAIAQDPVRGPFYRSFARHAANSGTLRIAQLRIGDAIAAIQIAVEWSNSYWLLKIGFDPKWARCSPGILLVAGTVSYAARRGLATYEFLGTPEPWIGAWTTEHHQFAVVRAYPATVRGLAGFSADAARAVARRAKSVIGNSHGSEAAPALSAAQAMSQSSAGQVEAFR